MIKKNFLHIFILILLITTGTLRASVTDSLLNVVNSAGADSGKVNALNRLFLEVEFKDPDKAYEYLKQALTLSQKSNYKKGEALSYTHQGFYYDDMGEYKQALEVYKKALDIYLSLNDVEGVAKTYNLMGIIYKSLAEYTPAIEFFKKSLVIFESKKDKKGIASGYNNLGLTYDAVGDNAKALTNYFTAIKIYEEIQNNQGLAASYCNIAVIYEHEKKYSQALEYYNKALKLNLESGNKNWEAVNYNNIGNVYGATGNQALSLQNHLLALDLRNKIGDKFGIASSSGNIGNIYYEMDSLEKAMSHYNVAVEIYKNIGARKFYILTLTGIAKVNIKWRNFDKALTILKEATAMANEIGDNQELGLSYSTYSLAFEEKGDYKKSLEYYKLYLSVYDTIYSENSQKLLSEMQTKYETEKKEKEILLLNKEKEVSNLELEKRKEELEKQRILIYSFILGFAIILIFSIMLYQQYSAKKRANIKLAFQNVEIHQKNEEISAQRDEITAQRDLVMQQKQEIEEIHKDQTDSIHYAKRIQTAVLPDLQKGFAFAKGGIFEDYFILFKPRNIVSGDFYYAVRINQYIILAVADCTGHGVPGAFMSMLGVSFLNEIVRKKPAYRQGREVTKASQVLDSLRESIIEALQQVSTADTSSASVSGGMKDGMDIALCVLDTQTNLLEFSGANNPLYVIARRCPERVEGAKPEAILSIEQIASPACRLTRNDEYRLLEVKADVSAETRLIEVKADKMPIAIHPVMKPFANHEIAYSKGDCIYLTSDGYADQFGGPKGKKFKAKQFKELIISVSAMPMVEQQKILNQTIEDWRTGHEHQFEQTDDITIMGIRI